MNRSPFVLSLWCVLFLLGSCVGLACTTSSSDSGGGSDAGALPDTGQGPGTNDGGPGGDAADDGGGSDTGADAPNATGPYTIGGSASGLTGQGLVLQNNGKDNLAVNADGTFTFSQPLVHGVAYAVTVLSQPSSPTQTCTVANGTGTVGTANVTDVHVTCVTARYSLGGTVTGLSGSGLVLQDSAAGTLAVSANGAFTLPTSVASGTPFAVTVKTQPTNPTQTCNVTGGTGTVGTGNITGVVVNCAANTYTVGGNITGLKGTVVLQNNGGNALTLNANGSFAFSTPVASGATYAVTVLTQPPTPSQTCTVTAGTGTIASANVTTVAVDCVTNKFTVGGTVTGYTGTGLELRNNGADNLSPAGNGAFTFATALLSGSTYAVTISKQPATQTCSVSSGGTGTVGAANVTNVSINCQTPGTLLAKGNVTVWGITSDGYVLYVDNAANQAYVVPLAGGAPTSLMAVGTNYKVGAGGAPTVTVRPTLNAQGVGPLYVWTAANGLKQLSTSSAKSTAIMSADGTYAVTTDNVDAAKTTGDIVVIKTDGTGKAPLATGVNLGTCGTFPVSAGFLTRLVLQYCPTAGSRAMTFRSYQMGTWAPTDIATGVQNLSSFWSTDVAGDKVLIPTDPPTVYPIGGGAGVTMEATATGYGATLSDDGATVLYQTTDGAVKRITLASGATTTLVSTGVEPYGFGAMAPNEQTILVSTASDPNNGQSDVFLASTLTPGGLTPIWTPTTSVLGLGSDYTLDSSHALFLVGTAPNCTYGTCAGTLYAAAFGGGAPVSLSQSALTDVAVGGSKVVFNDNPTPVIGGALPTADIRAVDVGLAAAPKLVVAQASFQMFMTPDSIVYTWNQSAGSAGLYVVPIP